MNKIDRRTALAAGLASASIISTGPAEEKLRQLGIELPKVATPSANFIPAARLGNLIFLEGTGPRNPDALGHEAKLGEGRHRIRAPRSQNARGSVIAVRDAMIAIAKRPPKMGNPSIQVACARAKRCIKGNSPSFANPPLSPGAPACFMWIRVRC
jgi:hypothetical protein